MSRQDVVDAARSYVGTPWRHQARCPGRGLDCAGFVVCAYRAAGYEIRSDITDYSRQPNPTMMGAAISHVARFVPFAERLPADVLWLRYEEPQHLAIVTGDDTIIHSYSSVGRVVEQPLDGEMMARVMRTLRHKAFFDE